jgi:EAL domain-containing protein (putative c-di-GMP-specific phosphodiesterase class I)
VALGPVPPAEFIAIAEETGLIKPIGAWVLEQACAAWVGWQALAGEDADHPLYRRQISVNISASQLADPELVPFLQALIARTGMCPQCLELEITESQLMDNAVAAQAQMAALKALGLQLSIDDFGTGYSSLAYLKRFEIDKLKVDRSFVDDMLSDPADMAITRAVIALGHTLGLSVVAEGVENLATADCLRELGCDELQGFHFSRPLPAAEWETWALRHVAPLPQTTTESA